MPQNTGDIGRSRMIELRKKPMTDREVFGTPAEVAKRDAAVASAQKERRRVSGERNTFGAARSMRK